MFDAHPAMAEKPLVSLAYFGGKAHTSSTGNGKWIARHLPMRKGYVEPFAGMLGILLQRRKSQMELVNDRCSLLASFWRCVRERNEEFFWKVWATPHSRELLDEARKLRDRIEAGENVPDVDRAWAAYACVSGNFAREIGGGTNTSFRVAMSVQPMAKKKRLLERLRKVGERIEDVQIENTDAVELMDRIADVDDVVIYCDPPYLCQNGKAYGQKVDDWDALHDVLRKQKGFVAVSGYEGDHDALGWRRYEYNTFTPVGAARKKRPERKECLWLNKKVETPISIFDWPQ